MFPNVIELRTRKVKKDNTNSNSDPESYLSSFYSDDSSNSSHVDDYIDLDSSLSSETENMADLDISVMLQIIPFFDGKSADLHKFCTCADIIWTPLTQKNDKSLFLQLIKSKLSGKAYEIVKYTDFENWADLKKALYKQFIQRRSQGTVSAELIQINQNKNENIRSFADKIEKLLNELNEICIEKQGKVNAKIVVNMNESIALNSFENGIHEPIRTIVKSHRFNTLSKSIEQALDEEISHKPNNFCNHCKTNTHSSQNCYKRNKNSNPSSKSNSNNTDQNNSKLQSNENNSTRTVKKWCVYCKKSGHIIEDCYKKKSNIEKNNANESSAKIHTVVEPVPSTSTGSNLVENLSSGNCQRSEKTASQLIRIDQI